MLLSIYQSSYYLVINMIESSVLFDDPVSVSYR
jgi:hypothetical protein